MRLLLSTYGSRGDVEPLAALGAQLRALGRRPWCRRRGITGEVNQQALFRRVAAVVHHGGAGTTTAAAMAGAPQAIVPQIVDQPY